MAGGGGKTPKNTTQTQELPAWARGYAKDVLAKGAALTDIEQNPYVAYGGERLAGFDPMQQQSFTDAQNMGVAPQIGQATQMATQAGQYNPADFQNQYNNQLQQYTGANVNQYMNPYLEGALAPQLREAASAGMQAQNMNAAKAVGQGAFGGTRGALQQSMTEKNTLQNMADINARGYGDAFNQAAGMFSADQQRQMQNAQNRAQYGLSADQAREQSRQFGAGQGLNAAQLLGQLGGQQFQQGMDINKLRNTYGQQQQSQAQRANDIAYQNFLDQQNYAYKQLGFMSDLIKNPAIGSTSQRQIYEGGGNDLATLGGLGALGKGVGLFKEGGMVGYADGGYVERLSDQQIATLLEQEQRKPPQEQDQERIMALMAEMQKRQEVRGAQAMPQEQPMEQGLAALPAGPMPQMASGGIVAFAGGDAVKGDPKVRFMEEYGPAAEYAGKRLGVDPQILLAQWGLESDYGRKTVGKYNLGNIKDVTGKGPRALDKAEGSRDAYKSYASPEDFAADYAGLISRRYPDAVGAGSDITKFTAGLKPGKQGGYATDPNYAAKLAKTNEGLGGVAQAQTQAPYYSSVAEMVPGNYRDPRQDFRGPPAPPKEDWESGYGGMGRIPGVLEAGLTLAANTGAIPLSGIQSLLGDKSFDENYRENVYAPRTDTARGLIQGAADVAEFLKIPPYMPFIGTAGQSTRALAEARRAAKEAAGAAEVGKGLTALAEKKVELPRLPGATTSAAEAKVAAPRLPSTPEDTSFMGRVRSGLADLSRRDTDQAAADAARAERQPGGLDDVARLKKDQKDAAKLKQGTASLAEEARLGPLKVQDETLRLGDRADDALYAQGVADRTGMVGRLGLGAIAATNAINATNENMPSGLGATAQAAALDPEDLSKDDKKDVVDAAKKAVPDSMKKGSGFTNDDWLMLGLQMLKNNVGNKGLGQILGESGLPTLMNKKEREKMEREQESQGFVDEYRQSQAELNRAQAEYYSGLKGPQAALTLGQTNHKNWLATMAGKMATPEVAAAHERESIANAFRSLGLQLPAGMMAAPAPEVTNFKKVG